MTVNQSNFFNQENTDMDKGATNLPEEAVAYLRDKKIPDLMEHLLHELIVNQPEDPLRFLSQVLSSPIVPKIMISGPPAGGKGTQSKLIVDIFNVTHISTGELLRSEVSKGTPIGKQVEHSILKGELVSDSIIIDLVKQRMNRDDVKTKGWLLDGFPRTKNQAISLQALGYIPQVFFRLQVPDDVSVERIEGRRYDPVTGTCYHLTFKPPPQDPEIVRRLEQRSDDSRENAKKRIATYHRNTSEVEDCYRSILQRVCNHYFVGFSCWLIHKKTKKKTD